MPASEVRGDDKTEGVVAGEFDELWGNAGFETGGVAVLAVEDFAFVGDDGIALAVELDVFRERGDFGVVNFGEDRAQRVEFDGIHLEWRSAHGARVDVRFGVQGVPSLARSPRTDAHETPD